MSETKKATTQEIEDLLKEEKACMEAEKSIYVLTQMLKEHHNNIVSIWQEFQQKYALGKEGTYKIHPQTGEFIKIP